MTDEYTPHGLAVRIGRLEKKVGELTDTLMVLLEEDEQEEDEPVDPLEEQHQEFAAHIKAVRGL